MTKYRDSKDSGEYKGPKQTGGNFKRRQRDDFGFEKREEIEADNVNASDADIDTRLHGYYRDN